MEKDSPIYFQNLKKLSYYRERFESGDVPKKKKRHKQYTIFDFIGV